ncbi:MAG: glycosyltransferase [Caldilineaceae bacterium]
MRILMCNSFYYLRGGAERCFFDLMALLEERGHEVIPFSMAHPNNFPSPYDEHFVSYMDFPTQLAGEAGLTGKLAVAERVIFSREARAKIRRLIEATKPDIAHIHGIAHETSPSILGPIKAAGIPIVQTLHDYKLLCPNTSFVAQGQICESCKGHTYYNVVRQRCKRGSLSASLLAAVEMYVHKTFQLYERHVDTFISPSRFLQEKVAEFGIRNPVVNIPNFLHVDTIVPDYEPEDYFVYSGRLVDVKGIWTLMRAMRTVQRSHLYIAGHGELEAPLRAYVAEHSMQNVTFVGHLNTDALMTLVRQARFAVAPSEWYENYPMSVLEAMACGTPVIGAAMGGIPEIVRDGENGLLFAAGNVDELTAKIHYLLDNPENSGCDGTQRASTD